MKLYLVGIHDAAAGMFITPLQFERSLGAGIRNFEIGVKDLPHKDDLTLRHLGTFDDESGEYVPIDPVIISRGIELKSDNVVNFDA